MFVKPIKRRLLYVSLLSWMLTGCFEPPFNNFKPDHRPIGPGSFSSQTRERALIKLLKPQAIEYIRYGDLRTLIIPTDRYFVFDTAHLNDINYKGLNTMVSLIQTLPYNTIYVAGFTDNVGSRAHKDQLSQARAEAIVTFLWANNINAELLKAEGYGETHPIGDNRLIHASAYNRRIEVQWTVKTHGDPKNAPAVIPASQMKQ
jgi:outer membrane protein OmpA-like peptidoglycan-associated protein